MRPRVFFDTNIILDLIQERPGFDAAARILQKQENGDIQVCLSVLSMANVAYVLRKTLPHSLIVPTLKQISSVMEVISMDNSQFQQALMLFNQQPSIPHRCKLNCPADRLFRQLQPGCPAVFPMKPASVR